MSRTVYYDWQWNEIDPPHDEPVPMTNADRIRSMTDDELASVLLDERCSFCDANNYSVCNSTKRCHEEIEAWLKAEVKDGT